VAAEGGEGAGVEIDGVASFGLGVGQDGSVGTFDPSGGKRDPPVDERNASPAQPEKLGAAGACEGGQHHEQPQRLVVAESVEETP